MDQGRSLSRREFDEVIRRATELASADPEALESGLSEAEVLRIAGEVGLPERHVRRALSEVRSSPPPRSPLQALFGPPVISAYRIVPGTRDQLAQTLDEFLVAGRLLQPVRQGKDVMVYWPAVDWASQIARAASSTSRRYYIASAKRVEIRLRDIGSDRTAVEMDVDPGTQGNNLGGAITGGLVAGAGAGVGLTLLGATVAPIGLAALVGTAVGGGVLFGILWLVGRHQRRQNQEVKLELEGVLDDLEQGKSLEPPPASWRRWVKRHFGGVARDVLGDREVDRD